jgi:putative redox protein
MPQQIQAVVHQVSPSTSRGVVRTHEVVCDRPAAKGGEDQGMMGGELLLVGLGGCFMSNLLAAARAREVAVANMRLAITGTLAEAPARYEAIDMQVSGDVPDRATFEKLVTIADRGCIVANTLRNTVRLSVSLA